MAVLACLARNPGEVVTRDEFIAQVWGGRVVSDEALSRCVSQLRQVLHDDPREPRFIRTIARVGYTLLQPPMPRGEAGPAEALPPEAAPTERISSAAHVLRPRMLRAIAAGLLCVGLVAGLATVYLLRTARPHAVGPPPPVTRLLVLPFDTSHASGFGRDAGNELADEISDSLARVQRLRISGRTSAATLAASHISAVEAARRLGVDAVLDGAVAESGRGLRVEVRLTATDGRLLWSRVYERSPEDIFAVERSIASAVVRELTGLLSPDALTGIPGIEPDSRDLQAYWLYLRGIHQVRLRGEDSLRMAVDLFSAALRRDPTYARAEVGLATAYALLPSYSFEDPTEMYALADKALATADSLAHSHSRSGSAGGRAYLAFMRRQWVEAETAFRTAIAAEPNDPELRQMYSQLLGAVGRLDASLAQAHLAQELDPLAPVIADRIGILHLWLGQDTEAASDMGLARELGLEETAYPETKVLLKLHQHADAEAAELLRRLQHAVNRSEEWIDPTLDAYRHPDKRPGALALLDRAQRAGTISARLYYGASVLLESPDRAMRAFTALSERDANDLEFLFSVDAAGVRRDPAFGAFVRRLGLDSYWDRFGWPAECRDQGSQILCR
jgi:TolB-like protein